MTLHLITAAVAAAIGFGAAWTWQGRAIDQLNLEAKDAVIQQQRSTRAALERATSQVITAQNEATVRAAVHRVDAGRAGDAGNGLRSTSTDSVRAATADLDACTASLTAHGVVLGEISREAEWLATEADQWASQALTLQDGWTKD